MKEIKKDKDVTLWVSIVMAAVLFFPIYGQMFTSCKSERLVAGQDAQYWYEQFTNARKESILWRNIAHQYWQYLDYDDKENHLGHGNFFDDCISETETYDQLNELLDGDWEDFFGDWEDHHEEIDW